MARRRKKHQNYPEIELTFAKTGEKEIVKLIEESHSGKSLKVIFSNNSIGYVQLKRLNGYKQL